MKDNISMKNLKEFTFLSSDGRTNIAAYRYEAENPRCTLQISHGIAEYAKRYEPFADYLTENGITVYANDHLGHGGSVASEENRMFFTGKNGWDYVVSDLKTLSDIAADEHPDIPHFIFGHSMGSFLARTYLFTYPDDFDGAILCGTGHMARPVIYLGLALAGVLSSVSPKKRSRFLENMIFGPYNKKFRSVRTPYDWLSGDNDAVDAYISDELCGQTATTRLYFDLMTGLKRITDKNNIAKMKKSTPVRFISGSLDPVGENAKGVNRAYKAFLDAGMEDVSVKFIMGGRHEILNDRDKESIYSDVNKWITDRISDNITEG